METRVKKVRNGYIIDTCDKCAETKVALEEVDSMWMCNLCKSAYKNNLKAPNQVREIDKQQNRFKEMVNI